MTRNILSLLTATCLLVGSLAAAEPAGVSLLAANATTGVRIGVSKVGDLRAGKVESIALGTTGAPSGTGWKMSTDVASTASYTVQIIGDSTTVIKKGDCLVAGCYLRAVTLPSSGTAAANIYIQRNGGKYDKCLFTTVDLPGTEWKQVRFCAVAQDDFAAKGCSIGVSCGSAVQTIEVGNLEFVNLGAIDPTSVGLPMPGDRAKR